MLHKQPHRLLIPTPKERIFLTPIQSSYPWISLIPVKSNDRDASRRKHALGKGDAVSWKGTSNADRAKRSIDRSQTFRIH